MPVWPIGNRNSAIGNPAPFLGFGRPLERGGELARDLVARGLQRFLAGGPCGLSALLRAGFGGLHNLAVADAQDAGGDLRVGADHGDAIGIALAGLDRGGLADDRIGRTGRARQFAGAGVGGDAVDGAVGLQLLDGCEVNDFETRADQRLLDAGLHQVLRGIGVVVPEPLGIDLLGQEDHDLGRGRGGRGLSGRGGLGRGLRGRHRRGGFGGRRDGFHRGFRGGVFGADRAKAAGKGDQGSKFLHGKPPVKMTAGT